MNFLRTLTLLPLLIAQASLAQATPEPRPTAEWSPKPARLMTRWGKQVTPENAHTEYPRPTMKRARWMNLNGLWDYQVVASGSREARASAGKILVPFPIESALSGVARPLEPSETLRYWRSVTIPQEWKGQRVLLHLEACDWLARVEINARFVGDHSGGYDRFSVDITDQLKAGDNTIAISVHDPTDTGGQPRGKQWMKPGGIWYTRTSGIWQTVWLEPVPETHIDRFLVTPDISKGIISVNAAISGPGDAVVSATVFDDGHEIATGAGPAASTLTVPIPSARLWSPSSPHLYDIRVSIKQGNVEFDSVDGYFGMRSIELGSDAGVMRLMLNGKPLFHFGPLDQGFWPDGLYTAPSEEAMKFDIEAVKRMGGNMMRKHVKVEPETYYAMCDRLGVMVWQDIPSPFFKSGDDWKESPELSRFWRLNFEQECREIVRERAAHPSIVMWVPFNEGWGQQNQTFAADIVRKVKSWDPSRLVNNASGWTDMKIGDVVDIHAYPGPATPTNEPFRAAVLGEFGGLGLPIDGHTWVDRNNWGYVSYTSQRDLTDAYTALISALALEIGQGLCGAVYTQTTDVEIECNGWLTYDREVWKVDPDEAARATAALWLAPAKVQTLVPNAAQGATLAWKWTTTDPGPGWFKDSGASGAWRSGPGGFGTAGTPGAKIGTEWNTGDIWVRTSFSLAERPAEPVLVLHHDEDAEVYINGELALKVSGYRLFPLPPEKAALLRVGENDIAIHCRQTSGGQYIDCGLAGLVREEAKK